MVEYIVIAAGVVIARYIYQKNEAKIKGSQGERKLCKSLKQLKIPGKIKVMRDALFQSEWGTSQIDALAITRFGIIVCEMKNYQGTVYGAVGQSNWTINRENHSHDLYSPIKQNHSHISALTHLLKDSFPGMRYLPIVVFGDHATLHIQNSRNKVCLLKDLHKVLCRQLGPEVLSDQDVEKVAALLDRVQIKGYQARRNHVTRIQLKREATSEYTDMDVLQIQKEILESAKNKPVFSSNSNQIEREVVHPENSHRLFNKIEEAEKRQKVSKNRNPYRHHDSMIH